MSGISDIAREVYNDDLASEKVGHPVHFKVMSDLDGGHPDPEGRDALVLYPREHLDRFKGDMYAYYQFAAETTVDELQRAFDEVCRTWREECLPNLKGPA